MSKTDDGSNDLLTSQALIESDVPSCSMRNIQVYKTGADLKARKTERQRESGSTGWRYSSSSRSGLWRKKNRLRSLEHMCKAMLQRTGPQLLFLIALCSVLYSRTLSLPYTSMRTEPGLCVSLRVYVLLHVCDCPMMCRPTRHADGLFTSGYSKLLGQLSARRYLESLIGKRVSDELMEEPVKRHSDAIFTDNYSRFRKQMAVKKYLNSVLTGKRSLEDPGSSDPEDSRDEPNTFQESYNDINVDHLLNNFQLITNDQQISPGEAAELCVKEEVFASLFEMMQCIVDKSILK
ncbi:VIP peptide [Collichthys lucidus]|nr:VIP peptide [Collichthys lucidus]